MQLEMEPQESVLKSGGGWKVWRIINLVLGVFFTLAGLVNLNDGDWYLWVPVYGVSALLCLPLVLKPQWSVSKIWNTVVTILFTLCLTYAVYQVVLLFEAIKGEMQNPLEKEEGREMGGLLIIIAWTSVARFTTIGRPVHASNKQMMNALLLITVTLTFIPLFTWSLCYVADWHTRLGHCNGMF
ncbi:transmembrane protein 220-like isoform X1 [Ostrea edulis]|uniref:transmembrane protein 220-like isoform X1 n=2 Tax=Ostrea edulis TaxID=37623 RepID=UPI0020965D2C|nr:transmembrane protein 220-like isoform X1 [Ostrea edulis]